MRALCLLVAVAGCAETDVGDPDVQDCETPAEGCACDPELDTAISCFDGDAALVSVGACEKGLRTCSAASEQWGACDGQVLDAGEDCDSVDNDCDGSIDEDVDECEQLVRFPGVCVQTADLGVDGTIDRRWVYTYDDNNLLTEMNHDIENDGMMDIRYTFMRDQDDRVVLRHQFDASATLTGILDYIYQPTPVRLTEQLHKDGAGTPTLKVTLVYSNGRAVRHDHDSLVDGTIDNRWFYFYDDAGVLFRAEREPTVGVVNFIIHYHYDAAGNAVLYEYDTNADGVIDENRLLDYSCWDSAATP